MMSFQFTHPGKGATPAKIPARKSCVSFNSRTLGRVRHKWGVRSDRMSIRFNSRTLGRVRLFSLRRCPMLKRFQFTHPGKGATNLLLSVLCLLVFQFTHPGKGATLLGDLEAERLEFQFTHPGKGATATNTPTIWLKPCFNSRTLGRVRPTGLILQSVVNIVSIHAPWEGCDFFFKFVLGLFKPFQFTHPGKGATTPMLYASETRAVSIHAPWEGCDSMESLLLYSLAGFNSRTLGRVRRKAPIACELCLRFQFTHPGKGATSA